MKRILSVLLACVLLAGCFQKTHVIRLGSAPQGGLYYEFGNAFAAFLRQDNLVLDVRITSGSRENLNLLKEGRIQSGIAQSDIIYQDSDNNRKDPVYSAVASLYAEAVHIVVRKDSDIHSMSDLRGKIAAVGEETSGTLSNAMDILHACGLSEGNMTFMYNNYDLASQDLLDHRIDAFFMTSGLRNNIINDLSKSSEIRLIPLEEDIIAKLIQDCPAYRRIVIEKDTYPGMEEDIETIGVTSVLLVRNDLDEESVYQLTDRLIRSADSLSRRLKITISPEADSLLSSIFLPLHPGAASSFREHR